MAFLGGERLKPEGNTLLSFGFLSTPVSSFVSQTLQWLCNPLSGLNISC